jgi:hypothetical protein
MALLLGGGLFPNFIIKKRGRKYGTRYAKSREGGAAQQQSSDSSHAHHRINKITQERNASPQPKVDGPMLLAPSTIIIIFSTQSLGIGACTCAYTLRRR